MAGIAKDLLNKFITEADSCFHACDGYFDAMRSVRPAFARLATSAFLCEFLLEQLEAARTNPAAPLESVLDRSILVAKTQFFSIYFIILPVVSRDDVVVAKTISSLNANHLIVCAAGGPVVLETYSLSKNVDQDIFDETHRLVKGQDSVLSAKEPTLFRAGRDLFRVVESGGAALFRIESLSEHRLRWDYDVNTLAPLRIVAGLLEDSRLDFATRILAHLGDDESANHLARLASEHPAHFVRWSALQALGALDADRAIDLLHKALDDQHPHVRQAAQVTLATNGLEIMQVG